VSGTDKDDFLAVELDSVDIRGGHFSIVSSVMIQ
jgi:hypothetical protein